MHSVLLNFLPFLKWIDRVNPQSLRADAMAALSGAVIVLPQGVAFAMIAGLPPQYGLYTAIVTPVIAALFGSSRHLVSGPTTAISIVVFSTISRHTDPGTPEFISLAITMTFLAGVYQLAFGLARLGRLANFVSHSVVVGFTAGAALLIITSQLGNVLGIQISRSSSFFDTWYLTATHPGFWNPYIMSIAGVTLVLAIFLKWFFPRSPYMLFAMIAGSVLSVTLDGPANGVRLLGEIPANLPPFAVPNISLAAIQEVGSEAFAVAILGLIEAVSIGRSIATKTHQRIDPNQEFVGQGLSNVVGSFFSCYAGSGSFTRSGVNHQAGAVTPLAAVFAAIFLMIILLLVAPYASMMPIPAMGGIILLVGFKLIDLKHIATIIKASRSETMVLVVTFMATLLIELEFAIYAGVLLSLFLYLNRTAHPRMSSVAPDPRSQPRRFIPVVPQSPLKCPQLEMLDINGSLFFGSTDAVGHRLASITQINSLQKTVLIIADGINVIDVTGAELLAQEAEDRRDEGGALYISGLRPEDLTFLEKGGYIDKIGRENIFLSKADAIPAIYARLNHTLCSHCTRKVFKECHDADVADLFDDNGEPASKNTKPA